MKSETEMEKVEKIEKVEKEESRSVNFTQVRDGLFREAAKLVSEEPSTRIAILASPPPSESDVSIQSFGYPSVEGVVQTFLEDNFPVPVPEDAEEDDECPSPHRFWWEDDKLVDSMNPEQLKAAIDELSRLKNHIRMSRHLGARERDQCSENQEHRNNDEAGSKP